VFLGAVAFCVTATTFPNVPRAEPNCEAIPAGPARTDCYIGLSRLFREKSNIAAGTARQQADIAKLRQVTGQGRKKTKAAKYAKKGSFKARRRQPAW